MEYLDNNYKPSEYYYITVATKPHPVLSNIQKKVEENNETIIILGESEDRYIGWQSNQNFGIKLREVADFLKRPELNPNDIVLFTDAYDVAYCGNMTQIIRRYMDFIKPIIFGSEKCCSPDPNRYTQYIETDTEFPYLNSGLFIGRVWALRKCLDSYKYNDNDDDQRYWTTQYLNNPDLITLDYHNLLFLNTVDIDMKQLIWDGKMAWYKNKNPIFVHVNGPDKRMINMFLQNK